MAGKAVSRNGVKRTTAHQAKMNILESISLHGPAFSKSSLAYRAYPGYTFRSAQGAAFAVAALVRSMQDEGLVCGACFSDLGMRISEKGRQALAAHLAATELAAASKEGEVSHG